MQPLPNRANGFAPARSASGPVTRMPATNPEKPTAPKRPERLLRQSVGATVEMAQGREEHRQQVEPNREAHHREITERGQPAGAHRSGCATHGRTPLPGDGPKRTRHSAGQGRADSGHLIDFHQGDPGRIVEAADLGGVAAGGQGDEDGRVELGRRQREGSHLGGSVDDLRGVG
jgi:hypothetical protein